MTLSSGVAPVDRAEVVELARDLIRIDTSNPLGMKSPRCAILASTFDLPFVICGLDSLDVAHQVNKWVDVAEPGTAAQTYTLIAQRLLGSSVGMELTVEDGVRWR